MIESLFRISRVAPQKSSPEKVWATLLVCKLSVNGEEVENLFMSGSSNKTIRKK